MSEITKLFLRGGLQEERKGNKEGKGEKEEKGMPNRKGSREGR